MKGKALKASLIIGGGIAPSFRSAMSTAKSDLRAIGSEIVRVERQQRLAAEQIQVFGRMGKNIDGVRQRYENLARTADRLRVAQQRLALANDRVDRNRAARTEIGGKLRGATAQFGAVAATAFFPIREAVKFETAMLGVQKQLNGARDASGNLTPKFFAMSRDVQRLGHEIPVATNKIADMVAAGLRMGIDDKDVLGFTRETAKMATAFEMEEGPLADSMGKIAGIFKIPISAIGELGDTINYLDDNAIAKGSDIISVMQGDLAGAATTMGLSAKNAAALASTFLTLGESAERADTASAGMLRQLQVAKMNPKRFQIGVKMLGLTADQLQKGMIDDPQKMILDVLGRIKKLPVEQQMEAVTRLFGKDWGGAIAKLANGVDEYRRQLELANGEAAKGSMSREFQARMKTTEAQWQLTKNRMQEVAVVIGDALLPAVNDLLKDAAPAIEAFGNWSREHPGFIKGVVGSALALSGLRVATLGVRYASLAVQAPFLKVGQLFARFRAAKAVAEAGGQVGRLGGALLRVGGIVRTIGTVIAGIGGGPIAAIVAAITVGALVVRKYWHPIKAFFVGMWQGFSSAVGNAFGEMRAAMEPLRPAFAQLGEWLGAAWRWITNLLAPTQYASGELSRCAAIGKTVGQALVVGLRTGVTVIGAVVKSVVWLGEAIGTAAGWIVVTFGNAWDKVKSTVANAVDWIMGKIRPLLAAAEKVGGTVRAAAHKLGFGGDDKPAAAVQWNTGAATDRLPPARFPARPPGRAAAILPASGAVSTGARGSTPEAASSAAPAIADHRKYEIHMTQQPGEDIRAQARRLREELARLDAADERGLIGDR